MGLNWDIIDFYLNENYIYSNIKDPSSKNKYEIFDNIYIEYGKLDIKITYKIDWPIIINIVDDYLKGLKEKESIKSKVSDLDIVNIKHGQIVIDNNHFISSSFSCIDSKDKRKKFGLNKYKIKQAANDYENLPFVRGKKYTKYGDFGVRGHALKTYYTNFQGKRLEFFGLSNKFENDLHINGFIVEGDGAKDFPFGHKIDTADKHFFGRMDNDDKHWTYLGQCNCAERFSERQVIHFFSS